MFRAFASRVTLASMLEVEDDTITLNVEAMYALLPEAPRVPPLPWHAFAGACGSAFGMVGRTVRDEFEKNARFFAELEFTNEGDAKAAATLTPDETVEELSSPIASLVPNNQQLELPKIIVTPCPEEPPPDVLRQCFIPVQDAAFGNQLCVPAHPTVNEVFPPLVRAPPGSGAVVRRWEYIGGHWRAVLPSAEEQARRGVFQRSLLRRRRSIPAR